MLIDLSISSSSWSSPRKLAWMNLILASAAFGIGYTLQELWYVIPVVLLLAIIWIWGDLRCVGWTASTIFVLHTIIAAAGFYYSVGSFPLIIGMLFALSAWDLSSLSRRFLIAGNIEHKLTQSYRHIRRLILVEALGIILVGITLFFHIDIDFNWLFLFGLIAVVGLSYGISYLLRRGD